jgi:transcriptional regulator with XRE-family HTH domain
MNTLTQGEEPPVRWRGGRPLRQLPAAQPVPEWVWCSPVMLLALARRDLASVFRQLQHLGLSQRRIAASTGQPQSEVGEVVSGSRVISSYDLLVRIAHGLGIPRGLLGLAYTTPAGVTRSAQGLCPHCVTAPVVAQWTPALIGGFRQALRLTVRQFGAHLGVSHRMVSKWEAGAYPRPRSEELLDTALRRAPHEAKQRFLTWLFTQHATADPITRPSSESEAAPVEHDCEHPL